MTKDDKIYFIKRNISKNITQNGPRTCEFCDLLLVNEEGAVVEHCFVHTCNLICVECLESHAGIIFHMKGKRLEFDD
ncbi:hypothetical protein KAR91_65615 [Candidatus Pacearchaeota archaeon]|nr:hypothetical protein [Candidatus Pacearchaeota archaeon]